MKDGTVAARKFDTCEPLETKLISSELKIATIYILTLIRWPLPIYGFPSFLAGRWTYGRSFQRKGQRIFEYVGILAS